MHDRSGAHGAAVGAQGRGLTAERGHLAAAAGWQASPHLVFKAVSPTLADILSSSSSRLPALRWSWRSCGARCTVIWIGSSRRRLDRHVDLLHQYLAGAIVVLMLAGGMPSSRWPCAPPPRAARVAERVPTIAHRRRGSGRDVPVEQVAVGDSCRCCRTRFARSTAT